MAVVLQKRHPEKNDGKLQQDAEGYGNKPLKDQFRQISHGVSSFLLFSILYHVFFKQQGTMKTFLRKKKLSRGVFFAII